MASAQEEARLAFARKQYEERSKRSTGMKVDTSQPKKERPKSMFEAISNALSGKK